MTEINKALQDRPKSKPSGYISKVMEKHSVFFVEKSMKENINGTPLIERRELEKINEPEKIMELILEREK